MTMKRFYLVAMIIGGAAPLYILSRHFATNGFGFTEFLNASFPNPAASALVTDLIICALLGLIVFGREARSIGVRGFWAVILGTFLIGFSFGMPLYFYLREARLEAKEISR